MCGILGIARSAGARVDLTDDAVVAMRDRMRHRGPDGAGIWRSVDRAFALAHRRLAVVDLSPGGAQPMVSADGRLALGYNGELYNDEELRAELSVLGARFRTRSDTETVLEAFRLFGPEALSKFRGMFALGLVDTRDRTVLLARDPMGIKPLYYWLSRDGDELVFASEVQAILAHPRCAARPDMVGVSAYLTTIRTTIGERTMFSGVRCVRAGECVEFDCSGAGAISSARWEHWTAPPAARVGRVTRAGEADAESSRVRACVGDSVARHLRADVPTCVLLSGGLDSTIIAVETIAARGEGVGGVGGASSVRTYCSGFDDGDGTGDPAIARRVAAGLGTEHTDAAVDEALFAERWPEMVGRLGLPLSTPNEVAINEVARRLRADGQVVALSGEGADELFGGYALPLRQAAVFEMERRRGVGGSREVEHPGLFQLVSNAWIGARLKASVLRPEVWRALEHDAALCAAYTEEFDAVERGMGVSGVGGGGGDGADPLEAHLRFHRRVNLAGLLARLDTATMLEGVEGRTPFADAAIAELAEGLPMSAKFVMGDVGGDGRADGPDLTKIALRAAYRNSGVPAYVLERPKASFPLPFQEWMGSVSPVVRESAFVRELFTPEAIDLVAENPEGAFQLAWPMINVALWARRWWG